MTRFTTEERDDLKVWARIHVRGGYEPVEEIEEILLDLTEEFESPISERDRQSEIRSALIQEIEAVQSEQTKWPVLTDFDRLELAFDMLDDKDIVARQNFTCCGTCGAAEINNTADAVFLQIGQEIFDTLKAVGLNAHWDGKLEHRIGITLEWQRRWESAVPKPMKRWPF